MGSEQQNKAIQGVLKAPEATIGAQPKKPLPLEILDFLSGGLTDPDQWRFGNRTDNIINTLNLLGSSVLGGLASAGAKLPIKSMVSPVPGAIARDPYGLSNAPMDRRVFLDRLMGNTTERANRQSEHLWNAYESAANPPHHGGGGYTSSIPLDEAVADQKLTDFMRFADTINAHKGWPNAVINPENMGKVRWQDPSNFGSPEYLPKDWGIWDAIKRALNDRR